MNIPSASLANRASNKGNQRWKRLLCLCQGSVFDSHKSRSFSHHSQLFISTLSLSEQQGQRYIRSFFISPPWMDVSLEATCLRATHFTCSSPRDHRCQNHLHINNNNSKSISRRIKNLTSLVKSVHLLHNHNQQDHKQSMINGKTMP